MPNKSKPLWKVDDQQARLAELIAPSDEPAKDNPLRRDVRSLGAILGQVISEQAGQELFESVETLRRLLIEHRDSTRRSPGESPSEELMRQAQQLISNMDLARAYQVTKAFATYFELTNLAETNHRKRRRRAGKMRRCAGVCVGSATPIRGSDAVNAANFATGPPSDHISMVTMLMWTVERPGGRFAALYRAGAARPGRDAARAREDQPSRVRVLGRNA